AGVSVWSAWLAALQTAAALHGKRPRLRGPRRQTAVRRINDERRPPRSRVVFAPVRDRRAGAVDFAGEHVDRCEIPLIAESHVFESLRILIVRQELSRTELCGALHR